MCISIFRRGIFPLFLILFLNVATHAQDNDLASELVRRVGVRRGVVALLNADAETMIELAQASELLLHVRARDVDRACALREIADNAGFGIDRIVVDFGSLSTLPYADNTIDAVIVTNMSDELLETLKASEVLRVLRPRGMAVVGKAFRGQGADVDPKALEAWADIRSKSQTDVHGVWVQFSKPVPEGIDEWTHWEKSADNNPVSNDSVIKAPYMTQFMAKPFYIGMPSLTTAAGGRTFLAVGHIAHHPREWEGLNRLIARNGYNGTVLWERKLPEGYLVHRSAFVAGEETFHMIDGDGCLLLDAATGKEKGRIQIPELQGNWKWMVIRNGILYVLAGKPDGGVTTTKGDRTFGGWSWADLSDEYYPERFPGKRIPVGFGDTLAAYDLKNEERLWLHQEETLIDSRGLALRDKQLYLYCPDRHLRCLSSETGEVIWTNGEKKVFASIEQPGQGLTSTPGWRTQTLMVATPDALIIQGQTRNNVVAVSTKDGYLLWTKRKVTNNPNAIYVDGNVILGVGDGGTHVVIDPVSGEEKEDLKFRKTACTRLTACADSFFVRGEGTLRFDRETKKVFIDGAQRPACNDGAMPAHGLLYLGPWQCDCNLSLIGNIAKCSAGDFRFDFQADAARLENHSEDISSVADFAITEKDWPTYRGNNQRSSGTAVPVKLNAGSNQPLWSFMPKRPLIPTAPVSAGGLIFSSGDDGVVRAIHSKRGTLKWQCITPGTVNFPPTISDGRAYFGCSDGYAYCLEASTGRLLWRYQAAPVERHIMVFGRLSSTWPVGSGVLVKDGVAYFAAGIVDHDGTYVYAVDAKSGKLIWQNNSSGHLDKDLRKGISVQGNLSVFHNRLLLAGGNQVSPAQFDMKTGACLTEPNISGRPQANNGRFVGAFRDKSVIVGGRILYSAAENVSTKGSFNVFAPNGAFRLNQGGVAPAWNDDTVALVNYKHGKLTCCAADNVEEQIVKGYGDTADVPPRQRRWLNLATALEDEGAIRWQTDLNQPNKFETVSIVTCPNAIVAVVKYQLRIRARPQWFVIAFESETGNPFAQLELPGTPLPDGLLVDSEGRVVVTLVDGRLVCFGA